MELDEKGNEGDFRASSGDSEEIATALTRVYRRQIDRSFDSTRYLRDKKGRKSYAIWDC